MKDERRAGGTAPAGGASSAIAEEALPVVRRVLGVLVVASLLIALTAAFFGAQRTSRIAALNGVCTAVFLALHLRIGSRRAIAGATLVLLASVLASMAAGRGLHDTGIVILPMPIFVASLVLSRRQYAAVTASAVLGATAVGVLQQAGLVAPQDATRLDAMDFAVPPIALAVTGALSAFLVDAFRRSLGRAARRERDYHEIFNATHEAIFLLDPTSHRIVDANTAATKMFGYPGHELRGVSTAELSAGQERFGQSAADAVMASVTAEGAQVVEWLARRKDGQEFWIEVVLSRTEIGERPQLLAVARDVSERKRSEERQRQSEKLQAVGLLAGSVAHDFNNQLTGLVGYAELLRKKADDPSAVRRYAERILTVASRAHSSTARLLTFTRRPAQATGPVDLHALVHEVVDLLRRGVGAQVQVISDLRAQGAATRGDTAQLQSALLNLGLNARDALPQGGQIAFRTRNVDVPDEPADRQAGSATLAPGSYVEVEVADSGHGMDAATRARVFEPFFTTRQTGTGLGLSAVAAAVETHGGRITVESAPGQGSVFRLLLPRVRGSQEADVSEAPAAVALTGLRVLVAEDDPVAADATREMLESLECQVTCVADGRTAVERYAADPASFDAVLLDLLMPRLGGAEALEEILRIRPVAVAVVMSGFDPDASVERLLGRASFLRKPFHSAELASALRRALP